MSRFSAAPRLSDAQATFAPNALRVRLKQATALLCGALLAPLAGAAETATDHSQHAEELSPTVITGIAPSSPLTIVTNPKDPRQPVPASDGGDYLKTIPGFALVRNGGTNGDPVLRGMFGSRLNILTNGSMLLGACPGLSGRCDPLWFMPAPGCSPARGGSGSDWPRRPAPAAWRAGS